MTECEAWLFLADACRKAQPIEGCKSPYFLNGYGLCNGLSYLLGNCMIDNDVFESMDRKLCDWSDCEGYFWPRTMDGARRRAEFCERQARQLEDG